MTSPSSPFQIPSSPHTAKVSIIDTTFNIRNIPTDYFMGPPIPAFPTFNCVAYSFLITHTNPTTNQVRKVIFDLGPPENWEHDLPPPLVERVKSWGADVSITKYVSEILESHGTDLSTIEAVIWSHPHWDHIGRISLFHPTTTLLVGRDVVEELAPGYPENPAAGFFSSETFHSRKVTEIDFSGSNLTIGGFRAVDFFQDGSFYLLDAPGHCIGHLNGLVRTTTGPDTFIYFAADSFHHGLALRPSEYVPLPSHVSLPRFPSSPSPSPSPPTPTPALQFHPFHPSQNLPNLPPHYKPYISSHHSSPTTTPFLTISQNPTGGSLAFDLDAARETIRKLQRFDGDEDILVIAAHDRSLYDIVEYFPKEANGWKGKGWKAEGRWGFLRDLL